MNILSYKPSCEHCVNLIDHIKEKNSVRSIEKSKLEANNKRLMKQINKMHREMFEMKRLATIGKAVETIGELGKELMSREDRR